MCFKDLPKSETSPFPSSLAPKRTFLTHVKHVRAWDSAKESLLCAAVGFTEALILEPPLQVKNSRQTVAAVWRPWRFCAAHRPFCSSVEGAEVVEARHRTTLPSASSHGGGTAYGWFALPLPILCSLPELVETLPRSVQQHIVDKMRPCISFHASAVCAPTDGFKHSGFISFKNNDISDAFK